jgi:DNA repair protein RadC
MERQLELSFHEETVSEAVAAPEIRDAVNELLNNPSAYASRKRVSLVYTGSLQDRPRIGGPQDAKTFFAKYWMDNPGYDQERFVVACLDTKNRVQSVVEITTGTLDASLVHPREVFKPAIIEGSSSIILSHNHPSGDTTPSKEDRTVTERLTEAGKLLGIEVLDHIIHGDGSNDVQSLKEAND